jgi:hypothetical protein
MHAVHIELDNNLNANHVLTVYKTQEKPIKTSISKPAPSLTKTHMPFPTTTTTTGPIQAKLRAGSLIIEPSQLGHSAAPKRKTRREENKRHLLTYALGAITRLH